MGVERKFVKNGLDKAQMAEYFSKQLERAGYGGMNINRTPMGTQVTIFAEKPGMIIGKGGKTIHRLTHDLEAIFRVDNPQIDVQEVKIPELNAQMMASRLAAAIERGLYFRKAGHNMLRRIMESGALGCEIDIAGKLTGPRKRTEKFVAGNILHAGNPAMELVDKGFAVAIKKLGVIGCRVRIVPPTIKLPGRFKTEEITAPEVAKKEKQAGIEELVKTPAQAEAIIQAKPETQKPETQKPETQKPETQKPETQKPETQKPETQKPETPKPIPAEAKIEAEVQEQVEPEVQVSQMAEDNDVNSEERMHGDVLEHRHTGYDYWHPVSRIHKKEEN